MFFSMITATALVAGLARSAEAYVEEPPPEPLTVVCETSMGSSWVDDTKKAIAKVRKFGDRCMNLNPGHSQCTTLAMVNTGSIGICGKLSSKQDCNEVADWAEQVVAKCAWAGDRLPFGGKVGGFYFVNEDLKVVVFDLGQ
ncbi:hypothetical protein GGR56DRAFT_694035 [Xylariaceae sp. FL0804]|nr:hypothetical protein GGR56DRAFT_694035 [Xylariaceae sp. FL0804]